ncbi:MAG: glycosyltransferase 87 family protein [Candidatus Jordarchaeaceae archaeon]
MLMGVLLRFTLMPYFSDPYDLGTYCSSVIWFVNGYNPYAVYASLYPPFIYFITFPIFNIAYWIGLSPGYHYVASAANTGAFTGMVSPNQVNPTFLFLWKIPNLCFDLLTGLLIYRFAKELTDNPKMPKRAFILWFFNPLTLTISYLHGAFDVIAAFFIILGTYLLYKQKCFPAGLSFGLGILTKLSPLYVSFPFAVMTLLKDTPNRPIIHTLKANMQTFTKFAAGLAAPLLLFSPMLIEYFHLMLFGVASESSLGGLNQWFFAVNPKWGWRATQISAEIVQKIFLFYPIIISIICLILLRKWNYKQNSKKTLFTATLFTCLIYLFIPTTVQPQYLLWILPLLVTLSTINRKFLLPLSLVSFAGTAFYLSVQSPYAILYPLAIYTPLYTPEQVSANIIYYMKLPGIISPLLQLDLLLIFGGIGFAGELLTIYYTLKSIRQGD